MSPRELQQKLLEYYTEHYKVVEGMEDAHVYGYLEGKFLDCGICNVANYVFNERIYNEKWVEDLCKGLFWCDCPQMDNKEQNLSALSTRIQILTELVKK